MEREQQQLHYWVGNTLVHGKDFRVGDFATTPSKMTKMATIAWGPTPRAPDDYSRIMSINTPRFVMFHSPRHPQVNERYFDTQLCFPAEKPQHFPYTDKELEHCKEFIGVIKRLNKAILNYMVDNCDGVVNWGALAKTMGYKEVSDIPLTKKQDWIRDDPKLCNLAFSVGNDSDDGETVIHGTRWYCIKIKIRAAVPDDKQLETYYFGKKKDGGADDERKRIQIISNATPAPSVHINLNTKINGKIEQLAVWPVKKKDDDKADSTTTASASVTRCASNDLNALIQRKALLEKHLYDSQQRLGSDITKLLPNGCTGQTILVFDHLTRKLDNKEASVPTMRIFGNVFSIIHTPKAVTTKLLTLDLEAPAELYGEVDDEPSLISDSLAASAVTTTNVTNLFDQESTVGNDDSTPTQANKFRKTDGGAGKLTTMSVAEMRKNLAAKHKKDDDE